MKRVVRTAAVCAVFNCIPVIAFATPAPVFQWTGFYGGVHAGPGMFDMAEYLAPVSPTRDEGLGGGGPIGGLFAGYNSALTGNWIGGIEAEANWSSLEAGYYNDSYGGPKAVAESSIAARLRLGFLSAPNTLV
jgi:outer membrane immunogenic protein